MQWQCASLLLRAPVACAFSSTHTDSSLSAALHACLNLIAAANPAAPPPTTHTSYCASGAALLVAELVDSRDTDADDPSKILNADLGSDCSAVSITLGRC